MNKNILKVGRLSAMSVAVLILVTFQSCGLFQDNKMEMPKMLGYYIDYQQNRTAYPQSESGYSAYFDLSDGLLSAYANPSIQNCLKSMVNKVTGNANCKSVFTLKNDSVSMSSLRQTELYNYVLNPSSYQMIAPIEKALVQITSANQSALLVTDFEEYSNGKIQHQNYAKRYFIDWLQKGNRIVFFVFDYKEGLIDKKLYFTVFDTPDHLLLKETEDALKGNNVNYQTFHLNNNDITFSTNYLAASKGGTYHDASYEDIICLTNESGENDCYMFYEGKNAEYYPFEESWSNIVQNVRDAKDPKSDFEPRFTHLISGLKVHFERMSGYAITQLGLRVTNIQHDFDKFAGYLDYKVNQNNADEKGEVLPEYDYPKSGGEVSTVEDLFVFAGKVNDKSADIAIDFRPDFSGVIANMSMDNLLRVDVVVTGCEVRYDILPSYFEWSGNRSLIESVKNTLQDQGISPIGKVIYTYYIKAVG